MSFINSIGTAVPSHRLPQQSIARFMTQAMKLNAEEGRKLNAVFRASGIQYRASVLRDYGQTHDFTFYPQDFNPADLPSTAQRMQQYEKHACQIATDAVRRCVELYPGFELATVTHLIVVSCTGMYAPGLDIDLVKTLKLSHHVERTGINFMGCYAAFTAMKLGHAICSAQSDAHVLIVCTELCSLHFQHEPTEDNLLANALFADGAAALILESKPRDGVSFQVDRFHSTLSYNGTEHMAWRVGDLGFEMKLSSYVPDVIRQGIGELTQSLLSTLNMRVEDLHHFAIHPGGRKILEAIEKALGISAAQNRDAYDVLANYGNMSSPTVLFVLAALWQRLTVRQHGEHVLSFAFGPGLTMESMLMKINGK
jgi:alpha-pyrone synthase